jgi:hypothetical protein
MPITVDPIIVPARPELQCNILNIARLLLVYNEAKDNYVADVQVSFYAIGADGKKVFARNDNGTLITTNVMVPDVYAECANTPELFTAVTDVLTATSVLYAKKLTAAAAIAAAKAAAAAAAAAAASTTPVPPTA